jgi:hypothetical protein
MAIIFFYFLLPNLASEEADGVEISGIIIPQSPQIGLAVLFCAFTQTSGPRTLELRNGTLVSRNCEAYKPKTLGSI